MRALEVRKMHLKMAVAHAEHGYLYAEVQKPRYYHFEQVKPLLIGKP